MQHIFFRHALDKKINSAQEAIAIAKEYNSKWDSRAVIENLFIKYLSKSDLINDLPDFIVSSGYNKHDWLRDVHTVTEIHNDTLIEFYALSALGLGTTGIEIDKDLYIPTSNELMDILDFSTNTTDVDWRELVDFILVIDPMQNGIHIRLINNKNELDFYYTLSLRELKIQKNEINN